MTKHNRYNTGFTVVELMVVIVVIGILITIVTLSYRQVQKSSRDAIRATHTSTIRGALEKFYEANGTYPPGCPRTTCTSWFFTENTAAPVITSNTTLATLKQSLPGLPSKLGDPSVPSSTPPIMDAATSTKKYYYFGGTANIRASGTSSTSIAQTSSFPCTIQSSLTANSATSIGSYVIGYFSEEANKWVLYGGKYGTPMAITSGAAADGCVINR
ncbi:MAG: prepilin-type N-terminal cleavage/methylation domain-containing protein [Candidatus Saccharimonadales bacterium]